MPGAGAAGSAKVVRMLVDIEAGPVRVGGWEHVRRRRGKRSWPQGSYAGAGVANRSSR